MLEKLDKLKKISKPCWNITFALEFEFQLFELLQLFGTTIRGHPRVQHGFSKKLGKLQMPSFNENQQAWLEHPIFHEIVAFPPFRASPAFWDNYRTKKTSKVANKIFCQKMSKCGWSIAFSLNAISSSTFCSLSSFFGISIRGHPRIQHSLSKKLESCDAVFSLRMSKSGWSAAFSLKMFAFQPFLASPAF